MSMWKALRFWVPLKITCSIKWAMPCSFASSSLDPVLISTPKCETGEFASWCIIRIPFFNTNVCIIFLKSVKKLVCKSMKKKRFGTSCKKNCRRWILFFCSLNIWPIFATRKRNGTVKSRSVKLRKKSAPDSKWCHSSVGRAMDWKSMCPRFDSWWHHKGKQIASLCFLHSPKFDPAIAPIDFYTRIGFLLSNNN